MRNYLIATFAVATTLLAPTSAHALYIVGHLLITNDRHGGSVSYTVSIRATRDEETDALWAYARIEVEGQLANQAQSTCASPGVNGPYPYSCLARAVEINLTEGCEYCGSGLVRGLRYNPNEVVYEEATGTECWTYTCPAGNCGGGTLPGD